MYRILDRVNTPEDIRGFNADELKELCAEVRSYMVDCCSRNPGHLASSLGAVELIVGLHYIYNTPADKIVFDVGHQAYAHKILTGRKELFKQNRTRDGISGFPKMEESPYDAFGVGHSSTSVSAALGLAEAAKMRGSDEKTVAFIGDGALTGGLAFEGLNNAGEYATNFIVVVNDNEMSIAENHGGLYGSLAELRVTQGKSENNYFKSLGFDYLYVEQGNDIESLIAAFQQVKDSTKPVVVHIHTLKGKGYSFAENSKEGFHWAAPFDILTGVVNWGSGESYGAILGDYLMKKIKADPKVVVIHSAVPAGIGFFADRRKEAGKQFIDVGIAEEHAVALASGLAKGGAKPIYSTHGTFIQRTYDQLSQDLCANNNPATLLITMSGADGMNDTTHLCIFDIPMMSNIPNLVYLCPTCVEEAIAMMDYAIDQRSCPMAIRIPNGVAHRSVKFDTDYSKLNTFKVDKRGSKVALIGLGSYYALAEEAEAELAKQGIDATIINPRFATGIDCEVLEGLRADHQVVATLENGVIDGGFGEKIARFYGNSDMKVLVKGLKKEFYDKVPYGELMERNRLTPKQIVEDVKAVLK